MMEEIRNREGNGSAMRLSTKGRYSLYAMTYLAKNYGEGPLPLRCIAQMGVQEDYLEQLISMMRKAGLVMAHRGANGGYTLSRAPEKITMGDIIRAAEGPVQFSDCVDDASFCSKASQCPTLPIWKYMTEQIDMILDSITLQDILDEKRFDGGEEMR